MWERFDVADENSLVGEAGAFELTRSEALAADQCLMKSSIPASAWRIANQRECNRDKVLFRFISCVLT